MSAPIPHPAPNPALPNPRNGPDWPAFANALHVVADNIGEVANAPALNQANALDAIVTSINTMRNDMNTRFDGLNTRVGGLETDLGVLGRRITGVENHITGLENNVGVLTTRLTRVESNLTNIETNLASVGRKINEVNTNVDKVETTLGKRIDKLHKDLQADLEWQEQANYIRTSNRGQTDYATLLPLPVRGNPNYHWRGSTFPESKKALFKMTEDQLKRVLRIYDQDVDGTLLDLQFRLSRFLGST